MLYGPAMSEFPRYAIYYAPDADSALSRFGAEILGYDPFTGNDVLVPGDLIMQAPDWPAVIKDPRKYGFHATLKAPFSLAPEATEADLIAALDDFARMPRAIPEIVPVVRTISGFTAVVPDAPSAELSALAQACVEAFELFRAPMTPEDRARRKPENLTPRQVEQLDRFGYPYVRDDFRFHMTLTGRLAIARSAEVLAILQQRFATLDLTSLRLDRIGLFRQISATSRFEVLRHAPLTAI
jgi:putative phosphonate metabolism protein